MPFTWKKADFFRSFNFSVSVKLSNFLKKVYLFSSNVFKEHQLEWFEKRNKVLDSYVQVQKNQMMSKWELNWRELWTTLMWTDNCHTDGNYISNSSIKSQTISGNSSKFFDFLCFDSMKKFIITRFMTKYFFSWIWKLIWTCELFIVWSSKKIDKRISRGTKS